MYPKLADMNGSYVVILKKLEDKVYYETRTLNRSMNSTISDSDEPVTKKSKKEIHKGVSCKFIFIR